MSIFFRTPVKLVLFAIIAGWLLITVTSATQSAEERKPIMDLERGGVDFFKEIAPSIVQVFAVVDPIRGMGGGGSGYIVDREGHFITNRHVSGQQNNLEIMFYGDENNPQGLSNHWHGVLIAEDPALDLAVVKVEAPPEKFHPVRLADTSLMRPGDSVATFGSPGATPGITDYSDISRTGGNMEYFRNTFEYFNLNLGVLREIYSFEDAAWYFAYGSMGNETEGGNTRVGIRDYGSAVQYLFHVDSAISPGNSGGPCLNAYGEAIGTNTWGASNDATVQENVGLSIPVNLLKRSVADILEYGHARRPWCGIALHPPRIAWQQYISLARLGIEGNGAWFDSTPEHLKIYTINPYSPAYEAGLRDGDVILRINGKIYENVFDIYSFILDSQIGDELVIEYEREGHGMPAAVVTLDEKKTRYFGRNIQIGGVYRWVGNWTEYSSELTY